MKTRNRFILAGLISTLLLPQLASAQTPSLVNYQGRVAVGTVNFEGAGSFRFALVNTAGTTTYWGSSADVAPADGVPDTAVSLAVTKGLYSVLLGDTSVANMAAIPASVWANADVRLRVWFNDGVNGNQLLTPDQRLAPTSYLADASVTSAKIADLAVDSSQLAASAVTSAKIAGNAVTSAKLANNLTLGGTTTGTFSGNGAALTSLSAANLTGALPALNASALISLNGGNITAASIGSTQLASGLTLGGTTSGTFSGSGAALTALSAANLTGALPALNASALTNLSGGNITAASIGSTQLASGLTLGGTTSGIFSGSGAALTALNATNLSTGTVADLRLSSNVALLNRATQSFTGATNTFAGNVGIGTTPLNKFHVHTGADENLLVRPGSQIGNVQGVGIQSVNDANTLNASLTLTASEIAILGGNVGIGITTPASKLEVDGTVAATAFSGDGAALTNLNGASLTAGSVTAEKIANQAIGTSQIADAGVTTAKLADGAVTVAKINDGAVTTLKLNDGAVTSAKIANQTIGTSQIAGAAITGPKLADGAVSTAKLNNNAVDSTKLASGLTLGGTTVGTFSGSGAALTGLNATNLATGTVSDALLSANIPKLNASTNTFTGNATINGTILNGSATGTTEPPDGGTVARRIQSRSPAANHVVARYDRGTLERDATNGGFLLRYIANPGRITIVVMGINSSGANVNSYQFIDNPSTAGTVQLFTNAQDVVYFRCQFGDTFDMNGKQTEVSLSRKSGDSYWAGFVTSTHNQ